ncbi:MAG: DUF262 domain-containing protein [Paludibacteraceae bacterium]|nr:DUF262 domain-containing protein [Paludibacteraceae bacterium]
MSKNELPLEEMSIESLFFSNVKCTFEIPIYQRNYAWEKEEITALIQDIYDSYKKDANRPYYIGTLVSYNKGDNVYEIIDGQQRLTTIRILMAAVGIKPSNTLTYRARKKSDDTIRLLTRTKDTKELVEKDERDEKDEGIINGYRYAKSEIDDLISKTERSAFLNYFCQKVHIVHYRVPKDIDLNHYFEIMNSRGEQLEKHEIVKAQLMEKLNDDEEREVFNFIWESCSGMSVYVQQNLNGINPERVFGYSLKDFLPVSFNEIVEGYHETKKEDEGAKRRISIAEIITNSRKIDWKMMEEDSDVKDSFQPIIDFPNFLLIVLKILRMNEDSFSPIDFTLDDKELLDEFRKAKLDAEGVRRFAYILLKSKYLLDNYIVHHSREDDTLESNPWKLQVWQKDKENKKGLLKNLVEHGNQSLQDKLVNLLSMFEVTFTARQRKNYLFYCLLYLITHEDRNPVEYAGFVEKLADRYFFEVYMDPEKLNEKNRPIPGSFDMTVLNKNAFNDSSVRMGTKEQFECIYGDGKVASRGVPLFVFSYLDYKLWKLYDRTMRGEGNKEESAERKAFFARLGCKDFGLKVFDQFYFSRTRRSLEHYYPQALATGAEDTLSQIEINCLGNYAMIGSEANSAGSYWTPWAKLDYYLDSSRKISLVSVASLKFLIMMSICDERRKWDFKDIMNHQEKMIEILMEQK